MTRVLCAQNRLRMRLCNYFFARGYSKAPSKYEGPPESIRNPANWKWHDTLLYYEPSKKIACFGFNKCLVTVSMFRRGPDAWTLRYEDAPRKLKELHEQGYKLVIFSNHSPIGQARQEETRNRALVQQCGRTGGFVESVGLPFHILVATTELPRGKSAPPLTDPYRKPAPGMWEYLIRNLNGGITPDMDACFFVGGAAGRPETPERRADHSDYDILFAKNAGLKFIVEDQYFDTESKLPGPKMAPRTRKPSGKMVEAKASQ